MPTARPQSAPPGAPSRTLLDKIARRLREPPSFAPGATGASGAPGAGGGSLLSRSGARYSGDSSDPAGFDPEVAAIFEAVVEGAYLVAVSDGDFDDVERGAFEHVVLEACDGRVTAAQLRSLLADLAALRNEDGEDKRIQMVGRTISGTAQATEVLRIAALIAQVSAGVSSVERGVLDKLATRFQLEDGAVERAIAEATRALSE